MTRTAGRPADGFVKLTDIAFAMCVGLVLSRGLMMETIRESGNITPGQELIVRGPSAATTAVLDLLSFIPAMLVAIRCVLDERFRAWRSWTVWALGALGVLAMVSVLWSADRFAAAVSAGKLLGGAAVVWTAIQWTRDWGRLRILAGILAGLLGVYLVHSLIYVNVDLPEMRQNWEQNRETYLKARGLEPGSFAASQFEKKVLAGELIAFNASANTLATMTVMMLVLLLADLAQRRRDGLGFGWYVVPLALVAGAVWMLVRAESKTSAATPVLGLMLLAVGWKLRGWISAHRKGVFWGGIGAFLLGWVAVIGHGLHHGTLFQRSLTFRWHYWQASFRMFLDHLGAGVGWENFGAYYTQYRLPVAPEEIRDPHNLFVRFATELGVVGLLLAAGWVGSLMWEVTAPAQKDVAPVKPSEEVTPKWLVLAAGFGVVLACLAGIDLAVDPGAVMLEVLRRAAYGLVLVVVAVGMTTPDLGQVRVRQTPAPILLMGLGVALAMFLVHSLIDFGLFETGPFYVVALAAGAAIGMRAAQREERCVSGKLALAMSGFACVGFGVMVTLPVVVGENAAKAGDGALARSQFVESSQEMQAAYEDSLWLRNSDYLVRKLAAQAYGRAPLPEQMKTAVAALVANPRNGRAVWFLAQTASEMNDLAGARQAFERMVALDPQDARTRMDMAEVLAKLGDPAEAARQYRAALERNDALPAEEIKRMPESKVTEIRNRISALEAALPPGVK